MQFVPLLRPIKTSERENAPSTSAPEVNKLRRVDDPSFRKHIESFQFGNEKQINWYCVKSQANPCVRTLA